MKTELKRSNRRLPSYAKLAGFDTGMHGHLFQPLVENAHTAAIPAHPDLASDKFRWCFVKGFFYFDLTVPMHTAPSFLEASKKRLWQSLQMLTFLFKTGRDLFTCRTMDPFVGDTAFPTL